MNHRIPISSFQITERIRTMNNRDKPLTNYGFSNRNFNESSICDIISKVSRNPNDCDDCYKPIMEMITTLDEKEERNHEMIYSLFEHDVIPKMSKNKLKELDQYISENSDTLFDIDGLKQSVSDTLIIERVATNHKALSKRFDIDKIARRHIAHETISECVEELCDLIDTYDMSTNAKFNIALENISYVLQSNGCSESIIENVTDYFLMRNPIITDDTYDTISRLVEESRILTEADKKKVSHVTKKKTRFKDSVGLLSVKCKNKECANHILAVVNVKSEKQASDYIKKSAKLSMDYPEDAIHIKASVMTIPLMGKVSKQFVSYRYKIAIDDIKVNVKYDGIESDKTIDYALEDDDIDLLEYANILEGVINEDDLINDINTDPVALLESEDYGESQDIKKVLNDFKAEQKKDIGKFKYYLGKIYRKSPESIIDGIPNIFGAIRATFIITPAVTVPIIGPITSLILLFVDKLISMKINDKQTAKLLKKLDAEREKVDKDIEKKPEKKAELEKYGKCIDACTKKVEAYRDNITSDSVEGRKGKDDFDFGFDDDDDFKFDDDIDFDLETVIAYSDSLSSIVESKNNGFEQKLYDNLSIMIESDLSGLLEIAHNCPISINFESLIDEINMVKKQYDFSDRIDISSTLNMYYNTPRKEISNMNDIVIEAYCLRELNDLIDYSSQVQEGVDVRNKIKLAVNGVKDKLKNLNSKQKELWRTVDMYAANFSRSLDNTLKSDRREGLIKGSMIPSFSKCIKAVLVGGAAFAINPVIAIIGAFGAFARSKYLNKKERQILFDEIDTELKVVEKRIEMANNEGDMNQYRHLLQVQKKLQREKQRIQYKIKAYGRDIPIRSVGGGDD